MFFKYSTKRSYYLRIPDSLLGQVLDFLHKLILQGMIYIFSCRGNKNNSRLFKTFIKSTNKILANWTLKYFYTSKWVLVLLQYLVKSSTLSFLNRKYLDSTKIKILLLKKPFNITFVLYYTNPSWQRSIYGLEKS
jgi:hypothetical protein